MKRVKVRKMSLGRFMPFRGRVEVPMCDVGLVHVRGENRVSAAAESNGCLVGDTLIDCPRDLTTRPRGIPIRDLVGKEFLTYSWAGDRVVLRRAHDVRVTGVRPVYRVKVGAGPRMRQTVGMRRGGSVFPEYWAPLELVGTADHPVLLTSGSWKSLGELRRGDRVVSLYRSRVPNSRAMLRWTGLGRSISEQQFVCEHVHGPRPEGAHAHHDNGNPYDNTPTNLFWKDAHQHQSEHTADRNRLGLAGWKVTGEHPRGMKGKSQSAEVRRKISGTQRVRQQKKLLVNHVVWSAEPEYVGEALVYDMTVEGTSNFVANGMVVHNSGKSALVSDAFPWVVYGETLRGLKAEAVVNRNSPKGAATGEVHLDVDGEEYVVKRTARPSSLTLMEPGGMVMHPDMPMRELQGVVESLLGFGLRTYRNAVVFGQGNFDRFSQADQAEQLRMLDEIQGLDLRAARERASAWAKQARESIVRLDEEQRGLDAEVVRCEEQAAELSRQREQWVAAKAARLRDLDLALDSARAAVDRHRDSVRASADAAKTLPGVLAAYDEHRAAEERVTTANVALEAASRVVRGLEAEVQRADEKLASLTAGAEQFERGKATKVRALQERVRNAAGDVDKARLLTTDCDQAAELVLLARVCLREKRAALEALAAADADLDAAARDLDAARKDAEAADSALAALLGHNACPTCRSTFSATAKKRVQAAFAPEINAAHERLTVTAAAVQGATAAAARARVAAERSWAYDEKALGALELRASDSARRRAEQAIGAAERLLAATRSDLAAAEVETYAGAQVHESVECDRAGALSRLRDAVAAAEDSRVDLDAARAASEAFATSWTRDAVAALEARASEAYARRAQQDLAEAEAAVERVTAQRESAVTEAWAGAGLLERVRVGAEEARASSVELTPRIQRAQTTLAVAEYWVEAFGDRGIRSLMFDSVAGFLNDRLAHHLSALAAGEVTVALSALTANKTGGQREKISVTTDWSWGGLGRGTGSAGQDRRVDLALFAALQDLAESRSARPFPFKVYDEPFDSLDARGKELAVGWLRGEAKRLGAVFFVTHSPDMADLVQPDQTWTVSMKRDGASVSVTKG